MAVVWPIVSGTSLVSSSVARAITGGPVDVIAHDTLKQLVESPMGVWLAVMAILVVFVAPLLEEVLYRGILQRTLMSLDLGRWTAIIITSAVFVAMHLGAAQWHALPSLFVLSLGFGWAYERTGRLAAPIVMHVLFNALNLALAWLTIEA
jgi:membrane protease YdiL (CAAX protease family)